MALTEATRLDTYQTKRQLKRRFFAVVVLLVSVSWRSAAQDMPQAGYTLVRSNSGPGVPGPGVPVGTAVFSFRNGESVLVTEAGVGAVEPVLRGRVFVDEVGTRTGVALVNLEPASQMVNLTLRDTEGTMVGELSLPMNPGEHVAKFVDELFETMLGFQGSLTHASASGLGAITLRQSENGFGEPVFTTLPVVDLDAEQGSGAVVFPHLAAGGGYRTQVILINPSGERSGPYWLDSAAAELRWIPRFMVRLPKSEVGFQHGLHSA